MNAKADVLPFRQSAIPEQEQIGMAAGVTEELFDGQHMEILSNLTKSLQELTRIRRKEISALYGRVNSAYWDSNGFIRCGRCPESD